MLFFRDRVLAPGVLDVFERAGGRMGDESREGSGEGVSELVADECLDC